MSLVFAAVVGSALGWFFTHPPEWFLRAGARFFGEVKRTNSAQRPRPTSRWLRAETSAEVSPSAINPRVGTVVPGPADPVTRCADHTSRRTPT
jgi:hypothetical protein